MSCCAVCSAETPARQGSLCDYCLDDAHDMPDTFEAGTLVDGAVCAELHPTESDALGNVIAYANHEGWTMPDRLRDADGLSGEFVDGVGDVVGAWWVVPAEDH